MNRHQPYRPPLPQPPADFIRVDTCYTRRSMNPYSGISPVPASAPGHRAVVPPGQGGRRETSSYRALAPGGALLTANSTYTFSAKEKDSETGLSYFGSRYYNSDLSIWLSVDPMADKYPSMSSYVYCANNPVKLVDPNGEDIWEINEEGRIINHDKSFTEKDIVHNIFARWENCRHL